MAKQETESAKVTDIDSLTVSAAVLGNIFGVTDRRIRQMAEEGIIVRAAKGRYNLVDSLKNYILSLKLAVDSNDSDNPDGELNFEEEKSPSRKSQTAYFRNEIADHEGRTSQGGRRSPCYDRYVIVLQNKNDEHSGQKSPSPGRPRRRLHQGTSDVGSHGSAERN